jgi:hypothetical protein
VPFGGFVTCSLSTFLRAGKRLFFVHVEITPAAITVVDDHPEQPGKVPFRAELGTRNVIGQMTWEYYAYPFLDLRNHVPTVQRAIDRLLKETAGTGVTRDRLMSRAHLR